MSNGSTPTHDDNLRYRSGESAGDRTRRRPLGVLEWLTAFHLSLFLIGATWAFGGQAEWVRGPLTAWGTLGALITLAVVLEPNADRSQPHSKLWWALPVIAFNALVLLASLTPSFREVRYGNEIMLINNGVSSWWPSSARPALSLRALWTFDAIWLACFNIGLVIRRRRTIRLILLTALLNAVALAIFGTVQKLMGSSGLFFGRVPSPQKYFFASFVYHNHWGAYAVLMIAVCFAVVAHYVRRHESRDFFHSPALAGVVAVLILLAAIPLSSSRSCTLLAIALIAIAFTRWLVRLFRQRQREHESVIPPLTITVIAMGLGAIAVWSLARDTLKPRVELTLQQLEHARTSTTPDARLQLYRDTWRMAQDQKWFGWGMGSYPHVFTLYNTRESIDHLPVFYHDAHSDWLQALAEHGLVGSTMLLLAVLLPLIGAWPALRESGLTGYLLAGCGLIVAYAAVEFPFGNFAVVLVWWMLFYCAIHYARLTTIRNRSA